jgi:hypothetical protein
VLIIKENEMTQNVGGLDRVLRIVVGLVLIGLAYSGTVGAWGYIGIVPLLTGTFRYCPAYSIFGCKTGSSCKADSK